MRPPLRRSSVPASSPRASRARTDGVRRTLRRRSGVRLAAETFSLSRDTPPGPAARADCFRRASTMRGGRCRRAMASHSSRSPSRSALRRRSTPSAGAIARMTDGRTRRTSAPVAPKASTARLRARGCAAVRCRTCRSSRRSAPQGSRIGSEGSLHQRNGNARGAPQSGGRETRGAPQGAG